MAAPPLPGRAEEDAQGPWGCPWTPQAACSSLGTEPPSLGSSFPAARSIKPRRVQHVPADRHQAAAKPCLDFITACCFSHLPPHSGCRRVPPRHEELAGFFCDSTAPVFGGSISTLFFFPQPKQSLSPSLNALRQDSSGEMSSVCFGRDLSSFAARSDHFRPESTPEKHFQGYFYPQASVKNNDRCANRF